MGKKELSRGLRHEWQPVSAFWSLNQIAGDISRLIDAGLTPSIRRNLKSGLSHLCVSPFPLRTRGLYHRVSQHSLYLIMIHRDLLLAQPFRHVLSSGSSGALI